MRLLGSNCGSVNHGQLTITTSAIQLSAQLQTPLSAGVFIKPFSTNSGIVYVGNSSAVTASTGVQLIATDSPLFWPSDDVENVYVIASAAGQKISWWCA